MELLVSLVQLELQVPPVGLVRLVHLGLQESQVP